MARVSRASGRSSGPTLYRAVSITHVTNGGARAHLDCDFDQVVFEKHIGADWVLQLRDRTTWGSGDYSTSR